MTHRPTLRLASSIAAGLAASTMAASAHAGGAFTVPLPAPAAAAAVEVFFSPGANTDQAIAAAILAARKRVWLVGYYFTSAPIAKALHQAHERGIDVRVVLDRSQATAKYSSATYFHNQGVPLMINSRYPILHHKFIVIDADMVGLGSMNFTKSGAQQNAENFNLFRRWPALTDTYAKEFQRLQRESETYRPGMRFDRPAQASETTE